MGAIIWISRFAFSSVAPAIKDEFHLTYTQIGIPPMITLAFAATGYALGGFLTYRFGWRSTLLLALLSMVVSALGTATSMMFDTVVLFQGVSGFSEGFFYMGAIVLLTSSFDSSAIGRALGILEAAVNSGIVVSLFIGPIITLACGWRCVYYLAAALGTSAVILLAVSSRKSSGSSNRVDTKILTNHYVIFLIVTLALNFLCFWSFWTFIPTYLRDDLHLSLAMIGTVTSISFGLTIFAPLFGGFLADRVGPKRAALTATLAYTFGLLVFALTTSLVAVLLILLVIAVSQTFLYPVLLSFIPKHFPQTELGVAYGLTMFVAISGGVMGPILVGHVADAYGFGLGFLILACCMGSSAFVIAKEL
jgi:MFS family permease